MNRLQGESVECGQNRTRSSIVLVQDFIHRATSVTLEVERHIFEPQLPKAPRQIVDHINAQCSRHFSRSNLKTNQAVVVTHAEFSKSQLPKNLFATIHRRQAFDCNGNSVSYAGRETGTGRFIPGRQAIPAAQ